MSSAIGSKHPISLDASDRGYATGPFDGYKSEDSSASVHISREDGNDEEESDEDEEEQMERLREEEMDIDTEEEADRQIIDNLDPEQQKDLLMALEQLKIEVYNKEIHFHTK